MCADPGGGITLHQVKFSFLHSCEKCSISCCLRTMTRWKSGRVEVCSEPMLPWQLKRLLLVVLYVLYLWGRQTQTQTLSISCRNTRAENWVLSLLCLHTVHFESAASVPTAAVDSLTEGSCQRTKRKKKEKYFRGKAAIINPISTSNSIKWRQFS